MASVVDEPMVTPPVDVTGMTTPEHEGTVLMSANEPGMSPMAAPVPTREVDGTAREPSMNVTAAIEAPSVSISSSDRLEVVPDHPDPKVGHELLRRALGIKSKAFYKSYLQYLIRACQCARPNGTSG
jgi:hypothetical protein